MYSKISFKTLGLKLIALSLTVWCLPLHAALSGEDASGSEDLGWIKRYPDSIIRAYRTEEVSRYGLKLGKIKKVNGIWRCDREKFLNGQLTRVTYEVPQEQRLEDIRLHMHYQLQLLENELLYRCSGRECGSSNEWANTVFRVNNLYGPDRNQYYEAYRLRLADQTVFLAWYMTRRGNARVFMHLDWLQQEVDSNAVTAKAVIDNLDQNGRLVFNQKDMSAASLPETLRVVVDYLKKQGDTPVYLVGHAYGREPYEVLYQRSLDYARDVATRMQGLGLAISAISVHGVGPLSPEGPVTSPKDRVELVIYH